MRQQLPALPPDVDVKPGADLAFYGLDSLAVVSVIIALQEAFDVEIPDSALSPENFRTLERICSLMQGLDPAG
ncbi:MAG: phosphopantetheine-binding protein [Pseudonocardia sp.]